MSGEEVVDAKLIDFQMMSINHPAYDLGYLIYVNTDLAFRKEHLEHCLDVYYATLREYLSPPASDITFEQFKQEFEEYRNVFIFGGLVVRLSLSSSAALSQAVVRKAWTCSLEALIYF